MKSIITTIAALFLLTLSLSAAPQNLNKKGIAIKGYDPVAYFTLGQPTKGKAQFSTTHQGATYHFASATHQAKFQKNPAKYLPAYGGYCAYGVSVNKLIKINPKVFYIHQGRLMLQVNRKFAKKFEANANDNVSLADRNWKGLSKK